MSIDEIIHQPVRTQILALLLNNGETDYSAIKEELSITDGHMSTHMKKLITAEYVSVRKLFENNRPKTKYALSKKGRKSLLKYLDQLKKLISP